MTVLSDYVSGTISLTNGSVDFTGTGTGWQLAQIREGDTIFYLPGTAYQGVIAEITSNVAGKLGRAWEGPDLVNVPYRIRILGDGSRSTSQSAMLREQLGNGNIQALAGLTGAANMFPMFTGPGAMTLVPKGDLINGVAVDKRVNNLAERAAYDGREEGFSIYVANVGDGRAATYFKETAASGDWSDPAYVTGPVGPEADVSVGPTTTLPPGSPATVTPTPTPGGVQLDFGIPAGEGFYWEGPYNPANAYDKDSVVQQNGSAFIAAQAVPAGEAPSSASPPIDTPYWTVLAAKGQDGEIDGVTPFWQSRILNDVDAGAALTGLGFSAFIKTLIDDADAAAARTTLGANDAANLNAGTLPDARVSATLAADKAFRRGNILGTVSQSGGVPTGAIVERGSNGNGSYVRFADGTQICWVQIGVVLDSNLYQAKLLPAAFSDTNYSVSISFSSTATTGATGVWNAWKPFVVCDHLSVSQLGFLYSNTLQSVAGICYAMIAGRWF